MQIERLVKMANEIAQFFASESTAAEAPQNVASHLTKYWDPRMRREIVNHGRQGGGGLSEIARHAVGLLVLPVDTAGLP